MFVCASGINVYGDRGDAIVDETTPPGSGFLAETCVAWEAAAAPLLSQELDSIKALMDLLLRQHVERLNSINRGHLPHEAGGPAAPPAGPGGKPAPTGEELIVRYPVEIRFTAQPTAFHAILNQVTAADRLYVIRLLQVKNQSDKGPSREDPHAALAGGVDQPGAQPPAEPPGPDQNGVPVLPLPKKGPPPLRYVVGLEKVEADLRIELIKIAPPSAPLAAAR